MAGPSIETAIRSAIEARVATLPVTYPIVWGDGPAYTEDANVPYVRVTWIPNTTRRVTIGSGGPHQRLGILQIDVMGKKSWTGKMVTQIGGQIAAHFPADLRMRSDGVTCRVTADPHVAGVVAGTVFNQVPVTVPIECFA